MNIFDLDDALIGDYEHFSRSFSLIRAPDIKQSVDTLYATGRFWPEPLVSINPRYEVGQSVDNLAADGTIHRDTLGFFEPMAPRSFCTDIRHRRW